WATSAFLDVQHDDFGSRVACVESGSFYAAEGLQGLEGEGISEQRGWRIRCLSATQVGGKRRYPQSRRLNSRRGAFVPVAGTSCDPPWATVAAIDFPEPTGGFGSGLSIGFDLRYWAGVS